MAGAKVTFWGAAGQVTGSMHLLEAAGARVLLVGTYKGVRGQYESIQAAVNAARPGDWILVGPGDYKTTSSRAPAGRTDTPAGVLITTPRVYLRGMNRKTVIVDGTKSGPACSRAKSCLLYTSPSPRDS